MDRGIFHQPPEREARPSGAGRADRVGARVVTTDFAAYKTAGGCPAASFFLLHRQKKEIKEKATPVSRPLRGFPALLDWSGGCGTRYAQTVLAEPP